MEHLVTVHTSNGQYYVWIADDVKLLRTKYRIVGSLFGSEPGAHFQAKRSALPLVLSPCEAKLLSDMNIAKFVVLKEQGWNENTLKERKLFIKQHVQSVYDETNARERASKCEKQLKFTGKADPQRIPDLPWSKLKLPILSCPNEGFSDMCFVDSCDIGGVTPNPELYEVFRDLWSKNMYVTSGMKFGSDFLAYVGDPSVYHSSYSVKVATTIEKDFDRGERSLSIYCYLNTFQRMCHGTHKIPLLAFIHNVRSAPNSVIYKTINHKEVLEIGHNKECVFRSFIIPSRTLAGRELGLSEK